MTFQSSLITIREYCICALIKMVPIEPLQRTKLCQITTCSYYSLSYITLLYIIASSSYLYSQTPLPFFGLIILTSFRSACNIGYLLFRNKIFLVLQKICFLVHSIFTVNKDSETFFPSIFLDLLTSLVWTLSTEQRNCHFDSRLYLGTSILKNLAIELFFIVWVSYRIEFKQQLFYFTALSVTLIVLDMNTLFYRKIFKILLVGFDFCLFISAIIPVISILVNSSALIAYNQILIAANILCAAFYSFRFRQDYEILYKLNPWIYRISSSSVLQYAITLQRLIKNDDNQQIMRYSVHHARSCREIDCFLKYHEKDNHNKQMKGSQILKFFRTEQLATLSKKYYVLKEYIIYNFENDLQKFQAFRDPNNFFHRREYQRFCRKIEQRSKKVTSSEFISQFVYEFDLTPLLKQFVEQGLNFWSSLLELKANGTKIINLGALKLEKMRKIDSILRKNVALNSRSQLLVHSYLTYLLGRLPLSNSTNSAILKAQDNLTGFRQASPTILVSAQKQNFLSITNANLAAVKATGYTKQQLLTVKVDALWQKQIRDDHIVLAHRRARYNKTSSGELVRSYAFLKNKFGYLVMADGFVYYFDDLKGKKWCVVLDPYLQNEAVIVVNSRRQLLGITQSCLSFGLRTTDEGKKMSSSLYNQSIDKKKQILVQNRKIFDDQTCLVPPPKNGSYHIKFNCKIHFMGKPVYYVFTINAKTLKNDFLESKSQISNRNLISRKSSTERFSHASSFQNTLPKFQFYYCPSANFYTNSIMEIIKNKKAKPAQTAKVLECQGDNIQSQSYDNSLSESAVNIQYDEDIIEMRLWNNKLDFLENLQAPVPSFQPLPNTKNETNFLEQEKFKEELSKRQDKRPRQISLIGVFFAFIVVINCTIVAYFNISSSLNRQAKMSSFISNNLIFEQYQQLSELSMIILTGFYNSTANIESELNTKIKQIDTTYIKIQSDQTVNNYLLSLKQNGLTLTKLDDLYRLIIKNYFSGTASQSDVINHFLYNIGSGWSKLAQSNFHQDQIKYKKVIDQNIWLLCSSILLILLSWLAFLKFRAYLSQLAAEICSIFLHIDNRAICAETKKYYSFKQFIDFDKNLIRQQSIEEVRQQQNAENLYPKKLANKESFKIETILLTLSLITLAVYLVLFGLQQINAYKTFHSLYNYQYYSDYVNLDIGRLWQALNSHVRDQNMIKQLTQKIQTNYQRAQIINLNQLSKGQTCKSFKSFLVTVSYTSIQYYLDSQYLNKIRQISKKSQKQLVYSFLRKKQNILTKHLNISQFRTSKQASELFLLQQYYFSRINKILKIKIQQEVESLNKTNPSRNNSLLSIFVCFLLMTCLTFWLIVRKIRKIIQLQVILKYIPFKLVADNYKYIRYREKVKIVER